jgi:hypothetical protein
MHHVKTSINPNSRENEYSGLVCNKKRELYLIGFFSVVVILKVKERKEEKKREKSHGFYKNKYHPANLFPSYVFRI